VVVTAARSDATPDLARAAVIAGRRVGPAVVRNRVKRQLRAVIRAELPRLPGGTLLVVRALPGAADAGYGQLAGWVRSGVARSTKSLVGPPTKALVGPPTGTLTDA
jgi:ribonuclease P protein component